MRVERSILDATPLQMSKPSRGNAAAIPFRGRRRDPDLPAGRAKVLGESGMCPRRAIALELRYDGSACELGVCSVRAVADQNERVDWKVGSQNVPGGCFVVELDAEDVVAVSGELRAAWLGDADVKDAIEEVHLVVRRIVGELIEAADEFAPGARTPERFAG
jgi:hypothetical protein